MQTRRKGQSGIVCRLTCKRGERVNLPLYWPISLIWASITSRCSGNWWARTKTGLERAAQIEPNSFAHFLKTKEYLPAGSTVMSVVMLHTLLARYIVSSPTLISLARRHDLHFSVLLDFFSTPPPSLSFGFPPFLSVTRSPISTPFAIFLFGQTSVLLLPSQKV